MWSAPVSAPRIGAGFIDADVGLVGGALARERAS
jgi:hypothetical protein